MESVLVSADRLRKDERTMCLAELFGHADDIVGGRLQFGWRWDVWSSRRPGPALDHRFHRDTKICRALRRALCKFSGTNDALIKRRDRWRLQRNLDDRLDEPL